MINVTFTGDKALKAAMLGYQDDFRVNGRSMRVLLTALGRAGRDSVRNRITTQGSTNPWERLSKWTRARTGRRKALITERSRIKSRVVSGTAEVYYETRSDKWDLTKHHKGFTNPATTRGATIRLKDPRPLGLSSNFIRIRQAKAGVVPARNVWGTDIENRSIAVVIVNTWVAAIIKKKGK